MIIAKPYIYRAREIVLDGRWITRFRPGWIVVIGNQTEHVDTWDDARKEVLRYLRKVSEHGHQESDP